MVGIVSIGQDLIFGARGLVQWYQLSSELEQLQQQSVVIEKEKNFLERKFLGLKQNPELIEGQLRLRRVLVGAGEELHIFPTPSSDTSASSAKL